MGDRSPFPLLMGVLARLGSRKEDNGKGDSPSRQAVAGPETPTAPLDDDETRLLGDLRPGIRVGSYVLERRLACGGTAWVFRAHRLADDKSVALKILRPKLAQRSEFLDIFLREAEALAELNHPNVVSVYGRGVANELHFLVMEYVDGASLEHLLLDEVELNKTQQMHLVREICLGVGYLHANGVVHGDLKPANVLVGIEGSVKLTDFGLARWIWRAGHDVEQVVRCCTPAYAAPELLAGTAMPSPATDIYALGVTFYKVLTGQLPARPELAGPQAFEQTSANVVVSVANGGGPGAPQVGEGDGLNPAVRKPGSESKAGPGVEFDNAAGSISRPEGGALLDKELPEPLQRVLARAMAPDPDDRYPTVGHFRAELEFALQET